MNLGVEWYIYNWISINPSRMVEVSAYWLPFIVGNETPDFVGS